VAQGLARPRPWVLSPVSSRNLPHRVAHL
jgi:hypothetical protein